MCVGPTNVDGSITLSNLADRTDADVRGVKGGMASSGSSSQVPPHTNNFSHFLAGNTEKGIDHRL
jgi:hypothetical protein